MGQPQVHDKRQYQRFSVTGKLNAKLTDLSGNELTFIIADVSRNGFGFVLDTVIKSGQKLNFTIQVSEKQKEQITLTVKWVEKRATIPLDNLIPPSFVFACGVHNIPEDKNLEKILNSIPGIILEELG